ncbi:hypothetical protein BSL78_23381 [Apostichopus japonicus]|uniref:Uncharacterized protein n=1 Tax=Stichopus japonicus TaxID=307972 RepID=A0A2G8JVN2_STIJA|nr:hypothetical protein BSL78_23381 [Apostichopus japonicus]
MARQLARTTEKQSRRQSPTDYSEKSSADISERIPSDPDKYRSRLWFGREVLPKQGGAYLQSDNNDIISTSLLCSVTDKDELRLRRKT